MIRALALFIGLTLVGLFALLNWTAFVTPVPLSLGFTTVQAPLGLTMLGVVVFLGLLFTVWAVSMQASTLVENRRQSRELQSQRELADKAEQSRFTELRSFLFTELQKLTLSNEETREMVAARLEHMQQATAASLDEMANIVSASIGELEDRLERARLLPSEYEHDALISR